MWASLFVYRFRFFLCVYFGFAFCVFCISLYHFCFCVSFFSTKPSDWLGRMSVMAYFVTSGAYNLSVVSFRPRNVVLIWKTHTICIVSCLTTATWSAGSTTRRRSSRLMTLPRMWPGPSHCLRSIRNTRSKSWRLFFRYKFINFITNFITLLIHYNLKEFRVLCK